jgi:Skp family chaperone for outer membrane proteins
MSTIPHYINIEGAVDLVRDTRSMGIVNTNTHALEHAKRQHHEAMAKLAEERRKDAELNTLRKDVQELKEMVQKLLEAKS